MLFDDFLKTCDLSWLLSISKLRLNVQYNWNVSVDLLNYRDGRELNRIAEELRMATERFQEQSAMARNVAGVLEAQARDV